MKIYNYIDEALAEDREYLIVVDWSHDPTNHDSANQGTYRANPKQPVEVKNGCVYFIPQVDEHDEDDCECCNCLMIIPLNRIVEISATLIL